LGVLARVPHSRTHLSFDCPECGRLALVCVQVSFEKCLFAMKRKSNAFSSDDGTVLDEAESISACVDRVCHAMARRYASAGRGDVQVRLDFDQGDGEGCSLMGSLPPSSRAEAHYSYGSRIVDDERGEEYMELDGDEGEDEEDGDEYDDDEEEASVEGDEEGESDHEASSGREWEEEEAHQVKQPSES